MDILSGFSLPSDAMWEMRRVLDKRVKTRFSTGLSTEGQQAMTLAREDSKLVLLEQDSVDGGNLPQPVVKVTVNGARSPINNEKQSNSSKDKSKIKDRKTSAKTKRQISFAEKFNKNSAPRLEGDITDENFSESNQKKRAVGGGKVESAMEMIETVNRDEDPPSEEHDGAVIEDTAKLNSVEKCRVWMEVNDMEDKHTEGAASTEGAARTEGAANTEGSANTECAANTEGAANTEDVANKEGVVSTDGAANTESAANTEGAPTPGV